MTDRNAKLSILYIITSTEIGGAQRILEYLAQSMRATGRTVNVCSLRENGEIARDLAASGLPVVSLNLPEKPGLIDSLSGIFRLTRLIRKTKCQIVHSHLDRANTFARISSALSFRRPTVISTQHGRAGLRGRKAALLSKLTVPFVSAISAVSKDTARNLKEIEKIPARKIVIIPNGIDWKQFTCATGQRVREELSISRKTSIVGTVARLSKEKALDILLEAMVDVIERIPDAILLVVGDGPERRNLERTAIELQLGNHVIFTGTRKDIPNIMAAIDVFAMSSETEGMPIAVIEAMAAGKPVVATNVGGVSEVVLDGETGLLIPPNDPAALSRAVVHYLNDPGASRETGVMGAKRVRQNFSVDAMINTYAALYSKTLVFSLLQRHAVSLGPRANTRSFYTARHSKQDLFSG